MKIIKQFFGVFIFVLLSTVFLKAQTDAPLVITTDDFKDDRNVTTDKLVWKHHAGDDAAWTGKNFDDAAWKSFPGTQINLQSLPASGWNGRAWFRFKFKIDESRPLP